MITFHENAEQAVQVLTDPAIYPLIGDDNAPPPDEFALPDGWRNVVAYEYDEPAGCSVFHPHTSTTWEVHIQVLPQYRKIGLELGAGMRDWAFENLPAEKYVAQIPVIYPNVCAFAEQFGFEIEGINKGGILKNGELVDTVYLGLRKS